MVKITHWRQFYAAVCANILIFSYGLMAGWTSSSIPKLESDETPLMSGPLTLEETSWVSSIMGIGGMFGTLPYCILVEKLGRKPTLLCVAIPALTSWLLVLFGTDVYHIYIARMLAGMVGGGCFLVIPIYVTELASTAIRGFLNSLLVLSLNFGILASYVICSFTEYFTITYIGVSVSVTAIGLWLTLHESPMYLMSIGKVEEGLKEWEYFHDEKFTGLSEDKMENKASTKLTMNDFRGKAQVRGIILSIVLMTLTSSTGVFVFIQYAETIFRNAGSTLSPEMSSIILATIQLAGTYMASFLVEKAGRKLLIVGSALLASICFIIMGVHSYIRSQNVNQIDNYSWLPLACLSGMIFIASHGSATLPYVAICEILEQKIRPIMVTTLLVWSWVLTFIYLKNLPLMLLVVGMHGTVWFFAGINIILASSLLFTLPETKGKSIEEILKILGGDKR